MLIIKIIVLLLLKLRYPHRNYQFNEFVYSSFEFSRLHMEMILFNLSSVGHNSPWPIFNYRNASETSKIVKLLSLYLLLNTSSTCSLIYDPRSILNFLNRPIKDFVIKKTPKEIWSKIFQKNSRVKFWIIKVVTGLFNFFRFF